MMAWIATALAGAGFFASALSAKDAIEHDLTRELAVAIISAVTCFVVLTMSVPYL